MKKLSWVLIPLIFIGCGETGTESTVNEKKVALGKLLFNLHRE
jgi:hypothetical protein